MLGELMGQSTKLALIGSAVGLLTAAALSRLMCSAIVASASDPLVFGMAFLCVGLAALAASAVPTTQAMRIDPAEALRAE